jgi:hypothetical protein
MSWIALAKLLENLATNRRKTGPDTPETNLFVLEVLKVSTDPAQKNPKIIPPSRVRQVHCGWRDDHAEVANANNRSARPSDSDSHGWLRLDHPGNAGHPLIRLQPVCMLICIGHNDHFVGASITCQLL